MNIGMIIKLIKPAILNKILIHLILNGCFPELYIIYLSDKLLFI
jgi:hypothetical protein